MADACSFCCVDQNLVHFTRLKLSASRLSATHSCPELPSPQEEQALAALRCAQLLCQSKGADGSRRLQPGPKPQNSRVHISNGAAHRLQRGRARGARERVRCQLAAPLRRDHLPRHTKRICRSNRDAWQRASLKCAFGVMSKTRRLLAAWPCSPAAA